jgi:non-homologous end joining protein Ku
MARSRKALLTLGLTTFNVKITSAKDKPVEMKNLCKGQPGEPAHAATPITAPKTCVKCGPITEYDSLVKGVPSADGGYIEQSQDEVAEARADTAEQYKGALNFQPHPTVQVMSETSPGDSLSYLSPADAGGHDAYATILKFVTEHPEVTLMTLHTPLSAVSQYILTVRNGVLALEQRTHGARLRDVEPVTGGVVNPKLYKMLAATVDVLMTDYDADEYEDGFQKHLRTLAETTATVTDITTAIPDNLDDVDAIRAKIEALMKGEAA